MYTEWIRKICGEAVLYLILFQYSLYLFQLSPHLRGR